jgi:hypothetical protein
MGRRLSFGAIAALKLLQGNAFPTTGQIDDPHIVQRHVAEK